MQRSGPPTSRSRPVYRFSNHTPRPHEVRYSSGSRPASAMLGSSGMAAGLKLVPLVAQTITESPGTNCFQASNGRKDSSIEKPTTSQEDSRPTSSEHSGRANSHGPFLDEMMTQTNLLVLPPSNPSYQMAYFLKTTGPSEESPRKPKKKRISSAMRLFRSNKRRSIGNATAAHKRLNDAISEGKVPKPPSPTPEPQLPSNVVQKMSKTGLKYLQIEPTQFPVSEVAPSISPNIIESSVSVVFSDQVGAESSGNWFPMLEENAHELEALTTERGRSPSKKPSDSTIRILDKQDRTPDSKSLSIPALSPPESGGNIPTSNSCDSSVKMAPLRSHPILSETPSLPSLLDQGNGAKSSHRVSLESLNLEVPSNSEPPTIVHPIPRRVGSQSVLLKRTTSDFTGLRWSRDPTLESGRAVSDAPGPPPSRPVGTSICPSPRPIEDILKRTRQRFDAQYSGDSALRRNANDNQRAFPTSPVIDLTALPQFNDFEMKDVDSMGGRLDQECRDTSVTSRDLFNTSKIRSKYTKHNVKPSGTTESKAKSPSLSNTPRRRLKRARPDGPRPTNLERLRTHKSTTDLSGSSFAGHMPTGIDSQPLAELPANTVHTAPKPHQSFPKIGYVRRPTNAFIRGRRSPAPKSRSVKMVRTEGRNTPLPGTAITIPTDRAGLEKHSALPSPPPKRELPPTPTKTTHQTHRPQVSIDAALANVNSNKALPTPPTHERSQSHNFPSPPSSTRSRRRHVPLLEACKSGAASPASPASPTSPRETIFSTSSNSKDEGRISTSLEIRLEAIERRNRLLEAALMAVLKTSGTLNGCPCNLDAPMTATEESHTCAPHRGHRQNLSNGSTNSSSSGRDVLDIFKETKVRY